MPEFVLSQEAESDLDDIHARISVDNLTAANQVLDAAYQSFQKLEVVIPAMIWDLSRIGGTSLRLMATDVTLVQ